MLRFIFASVVLFIIFLLLVFGTILIYLILIPPIPDLHSLSETKSKNKNNKENNINNQNHIQQDSCKKIETEKAGHNDNNEIKSHIKNVAPSEEEKEEQEFVKAYAHLPTKSYVNYMKLLSQFPALQAASLSFSTSYTQWRDLLVRLPLMSF